MRAWDCVDMLICGCESESVDMFGVGNEKGRVCHFHKGLTDICYLSHAQEWRDITRPVFTTSDLKDMVSRVKPVSRRQR